jgi:hypothetical protein
VPDSGRAGSGCSREIALDQRARELPLALHDRKPVPLELLGGGAVAAQLLAFVDERRVELLEGFGIAQARTASARRDQLPQSRCHAPSIGATAPKLSPATHKGEATEEVG